MSFIGKIVGDVAHDVEHAVGDVFKGATDVAKGVGKLTMGAVTGNGHEAFTAIKDIGKGGWDAFSGAKELADDATPEGLAVNALLAGAKESIKSLTGDSPASTDA